VLLNRVYPFRVERTEQELYDYFATNIASGAGISIDEVIAHKLDAERRLLLQRVLVRLRQDFPDKVISVWDASHWDAGSAPLLLTLRDVADAVILEVYVSQRAAADNGFARFLGALTAAESWAPGIRGKIVLGIGGYDDMRDGSDSLTEHLNGQVRYIARNRDFCGIAGVAIYAPVYLSVTEQQALDTAIRAELQSTVRSTACEGTGSE
jgi:hypothetical protein